jgi:hypothetical protein
MKKPKTLKTKTADWKFFAVVVAVVVFVASAIFYVFLPRPGAGALPPEIPSYFMTAEAANPLPETLDPNQFSNKSVVAAYRAAKKAPKVLAQQPCFCHCDRKSGHRSLLDCFATRHAAKCDICVREAIFATQEQQKGKTAEQIRAEIIHGDWRAVEIAGKP